MKCSTTKAMFLYFNLCLGVMFLYFNLCLGVMFLYFNLCLGVMFIYLLIHICFLITVVIIGWFHVKFKMVSSGKKYCSL